MERANSKLSALRRVAVIGSVPWHLDHAIQGVGDFEIVLVESTTHAYSNIKRDRPDVVVMCVSHGDVDACNVLSMLALDRDTSSIPVLTYLMPDAAGAGDDDAAGLSAFSLSPESMN